MMKCMRKWLGRGRDPAHLRVGWLPAAFLCFAMAANGTEIGTSSYLQVTMSFMPFTTYLQTANAANGFSVSCPSGTIQNCFKTIMGQMAAQGVTGIRVFVTLCDPGPSLAFANCGSPYNQVSWNPSVDPGKTWIANVGTFFNDVVDAGIHNVTILFGPNSELIYYT